jgi:hypothetical protein
MSSIFSDPGWSRGRTLLQGELIELDGAGNPIAGNELVGAVKIFQDVNPTTGQRLSNRLVYCVAARYTGSSALDASSNAGRPYVFRTTSGAGNAVPSLTEFSAVATATTVNTDGQFFGILDEYLTGSVRVNDIVWLVVKGPTQIKTTATAIAAGKPLEISGTSGQVALLATAGARVVGNYLGVASSAATADTMIRVNLSPEPTGL